MIKDLKLSKLKLKSVQIDEAFIDNKFVDEFITEIEIESSYFRHSVRGTMVFSEDLFALSIGKSPDTLKDTLLTFYFSDEAERDYTKRFIITNAIKIRSSSKNMWALSFIDYYGKILTSSEMTAKITKNGYSGKPIEIVEKCINDLIEKYDDCEIKFIRNRIPFINDNNVSISHRFVNDKTPIDNIKYLCDMYNIHIYQDNKCLYFIQNPTLQNIKVLTASDGTELYTETCRNNYYECKICDKIKQNSSIGTLDRVNYKISTNEIGKKHVYNMLDFSNFLSIVLLNNNLNDYKEFIDSDTTYTPSSVKTLSSLVYTNFCKYINTNTLIIYCRSNFEKVNVGSVVTVSIRSDDRLALEREKGDFKYNGKWLITSSTMKIIDDMIFYRLKLNRFDNPKDLDSKTDLISNGAVSKDTVNMEELKKKRDSILSEKRK